MPCLFRIALLVALSTSAIAVTGQEVPPVSDLTSVVEPRPTVQAYRLLFNGQSTDRGVQVVSIQPGSPVLHMESAESTELLGIMDVGDIISAVDGQPVPTLSAYYAALDAAKANNGLVVLTVLDVTTGRPHRWRVQSVAVDVPAPATDPQRKVHFLLVGLTDDPSIGKAMEDTLAIWSEEAVATIDPGRVGTIRVIRESECRSAQILQAVSDLQLASRDTLFCIYCGHGAFDPTLSGADPAGGHFFNIPQGDLMRKRLTDALLGKRARLTVLISDTCNVEGRALPDVEMVYEQRTVEVMGFSAFEELLFDYRGVVDVSGTDFGQYGYCQRGCGAWFSAVGAPILVQQSDWRTAFERMRLAVENDFQQQRLKHHIEQENLTPVAFRLDIYRDEADSGVMSMAPPAQREVQYKVRRRIP